MSHSLKAKIHSRTHGHNSKTIKPHIQRMYHIIVCNIYYKRFFFLSSSPKYNSKYDLMKYQTIQR